MLGMADGAEAGLPFPHWVGDVFFIRAGRECIAKKPQYNQAHGEYLPGGCALHGNGREANFEHTSLIVHRCLSMGMAKLTV